MKTRIIRLLLTITLLCQPLGWAGDLDTENGFKATYQQGIKQKDIKQLETLVCWDRVSDQVREMWRQQNERRLGREILSIELAPGVPAHSLKEYTLGGVTYRPNLEATHTLTVKLAKDAIQSESTLIIPVGRKDGRFYIIGAAPSPQ